MISNICITGVHIQAQAETLGARVIQVEKSIHALALLGHLAQADLQFIFKGGTSLLLHLSRIKRLSIDIDIMSDVADDELDEIMNHVSVLPPFIRSEKQNRGVLGKPARVNSGSKHELITFLSKGWKKKVITFPRVRKKV